MVQFKGAQHSSTPNCSNKWDIAPEHRKRQAFQSVIALTHATGEKEVADNHKGYQLEEEDSLRRCT